MAFVPRDNDYERLVGCSVIFGHAEANKSSKLMRTALQHIVVLRAGSEVSGMGPMHDKNATFVQKVEEHKLPLFQEFKVLAVKGGFILPHFFWDAINNSNNCGKKWVLTANPNAWKKYTTCVAVMRNQVLPTPFTNLLSSLSRPSASRKLPQVITSCPNCNPF